MVRYRLSKRPRWTCARWAVALSAACLWAAPARAQRPLIQVERIADCTALYQQFFGSVSLNDAGAATFMPDRYAAINSGYSSYGVFRTDGANTARIASFGFGGFSQMLTYFPLANDGRVAIEGGMGIPARNGIWTGDGSAPLVVNYPSDTSAFSSVLLGGMNDQAELAFSARLAADGSQGIYLGDGATDGSDLVAIARSTDPLFGGSLYATTDRMFAAVAVSNAGRVVFRASLSAGGEGLFVGAVGGGYALIADTNTAGGAYSGFADKGIQSAGSFGACVNELGEVLFRATLAAGGEAVVLYAPGAGLRTIADSLGGYDNFAAVSINADRTILFEAALDDGRRGLFAGADPEATASIVKGDTLDGMELVGLRFGDTALNEDDCVAFYAGMNDHTPSDEWTQAIYRARLAYPGDASLDGAVDISDLSLLASHYRLTGQTWGHGDFSGDGNVDLSDLALLAANYRRGLPPPPPTPVPEPAMMLVMSAVLAATMARRRGCSR